MCLCCKLHVYLCNSFMMLAVYTVFSLNCTRMQWFLRPFRQRFCYSHLQFPIAVTIKYANIYIHTPIICTYMPYSSTWGRHLLRRKRTYERLGFPHSCCFCFFSYYYFFSVLLHTSRRIIVRHHHCHKFYAFKS